MKGIADTGFLVAFGSERDFYHPWAFDLASRLTIPLLTCEAVLSEAAFKLGDSEYVMGLLENGMIKLAFDMGENLPEIRALARTYADRQPDIADLCLIRMSELFPDFPVWTVDGDFKVYRRNKRQVIPVVMPPAL